MIITDNMTAIVLETWLVKRLCPALPPQSLLILDNARFHHPEPIMEIAEAAGHQV